jgi:hypothetical protein
MPNVVLNLQPPTRIQVCTLFMSNTMLTFIIDIVHLISCALGSCRALRNKLWTRFSAFSALSFQICYVFGNMASRSRQNPTLKVSCVIACPLLMIVCLYSGRLVRVALVAVVCDKPAVHKMGGFASHSHTNFCTGCWISTEDKGKPSAFQRNGKSFSIDFACTVEIVTHQGSYQGLINNSARLVTSIMHSLTRQPA